MLRERKDPSLKREREGIAGALPPSLFLPCWPLGSAGFGSSKEMKNTKLSHFQVRTVVSELSSPLLSTPETTTGVLRTSDRWRNIVATGVHCRIGVLRVLKSFRYKELTVLGAYGNRRVICGGGFGNISEGIDSCLGRIDSHDSGLKENVILGLQSRFSHCPNRFKFSQRARILV
ncbi:hypothetical protein PIB30_090251 [Stylosanthes scabra]|uniref:Uncharacterized protein n=1 Tax=Stylosanthes scabra TaxID=79078 RepID=A0ABU6YT06_9FABA|nr:hypothetical protein [Stylosanthes scabra]